MEPQTGKAVEVPGPKAGDKYECDFCGKAMIRGQKNNRYCSKPCRSNYNTFIWLAKKRQEMRLENAKSPEDQAPGAAEDKNGQDSGPAGS